MTFSTQISIPRSNNSINYDSTIFSIGSCFAENIADKFDYFKFQNVVNPFGIIFNPVSIEKIIKRSITKDYFTEKDIFYYNDLWHSFDIRSVLSNPNKEDFLKKLNQIIDATAAYITTSTHIIITLGTAWVYQHIESNNIVANCHKVPQKHFEKVLLDIAIIKESLCNITSLITNVNKKAQFIFTISPVRHLKDGFVENNNSKARLIVALHDVLNNQLPNLHYFPSYEVVMDELRDYRFYNPDMLHPNTVAIDYIWELFVQWTVDKKSYPTMETVATVQKGLAHRPFNTKSDHYQKFLINLNHKINTLAKQYSHITFK